MPRAQEPKHRRRPQATCGRVWLPPDCSDALDPRGICSREGWPRLGRDVPLWVGCGRQTTGEEQGTLQGLPLREAPVSTGARASEMLDPQARLTFINSLQQSVFSKQ